MQHDPADGRGDSEFDTDLATEAIPFGIDVDLEAIADRARVVGESAHAAEHSFAR